MFVVVLWVVTLFDIFRNWGSRSVGKSIAWLIAVLVFPVLGTIVSWRADPPRHLASRLGAVREAAAELFLESSLEAEPSV